MVKIIVITQFLLQLITQLDQLLQVKTLLLIGILPQHMKLIQPQQKTLVQQHKDLLQQTTIPCLRIAQIQCLHI